MKEYEFTIIKHGVPTSIKLEVAEDHIIVNGKRLELVGNDYLFKGVVVMTQTDVLEMTSAFDEIDNALGE